MTARRPAVVKSHHEYTDMQTQAHKPRVAALCGSIALSFNLPGPITIGDPDWERKAGEAFVEALLANAEAHAAKAANHQALPEHLA